jgi:DNA-directed RNA polymerase specialized sigma24 family protein
MSIQLHTYVESRLNRWSIWYLSGRRPGPDRVASWWGPMVLDRNVKSELRAQPKVDPTETMETDRAVDALVFELRAAVHEVYLKGGTMEQKARALHCCRMTLHRRIERANITLLGYFNDQAAGVDLPMPERRHQINLTSCYKISNILATVA